nr:MFS transporter [Jiangella rhizosphaerae]
MTRTPAPIRLGLRENAAQFTLLVAVNALVGGMVGQQQTVLPLLAETDFGLTGYTFIFAYVAAFGVTKAATNYVAGTLADRYGRKPVLVIGWLFAIPVPLLIIWAPAWEWVIAANILLGINQGLAWSTTVMMKIDLVGPRQRGLAMGLNEAAGYSAVAVTSVLAGDLAEQHGLRPAPFLLGLSYAALALLLSTLFIRETRDHIALETASAAPSPARDRQIFAHVTWREPALSAASQAGLVNNLNSACPGACSPCSSPPPTSPSPRSASSSPSTPPSGAPASLQPVGCPIDGAANPWSPAACSSTPVRWPSSRPTTTSRAGQPEQFSSASAPQWSTLRCSPPSATSPTPPGAAAPSASTGSGATSATLSVPSSAASSPTPSASRRPSRPLPHCP